MVEENLRPRRASQAMDLQAASLALLQFHGEASRDAARVARELLRGRTTHDPFCSALIEKILEKLPFVDDDAERSALGRFLTAIAFYSQINRTNTPPTQDARDENQMQVRRRGTSSLSSVFKELRPDLAMIVEKRESEQIATRKRAATQAAKLHALQLQNTGQQTLTGTLPPPPQVTVTTVDVGTALPPADIRGGHVRESPKSVPIISVPSGGSPLIGSTAAANPAQFALDKYSSPRRTGSPRGTTSPKATSPLLRDRGRSSTANSIPIPDIPKSTLNTPPEVSKKKLDLSAIGGQALEGMSPRRSARGLRSSRLLEIRSGRSMSLAVPPAFPLPSSYKLPDEDKTLPPLSPLSILVSHAEPDSPLLSQAVLVPPVSPAPLALEQLDPTAGVANSGLLLKRDRFTLSASSQIWKYQPRSTTPKTGSLGEDSFGKWPEVSSFAQNAANPPPVRTQKTMTRADSEGHVLGKGSFLVPPEIAKRVRSPLAIAETPKTIGGKSPEILHLEDPTKPPVVDISAGAGSSPKNLTGSATGKKTEAAPKLTPLEPPVKPFEVPALKVETPSTVLPVEGVKSSSESTGTFQVGLKSNSERTLQVTEEGESGEGSEFLFVLCKSCGMPVAQDQIAEHTVYCDGSGRKKLRLLDEVNESITEFIENLEGNLQKPHQQKCLGGVLEIAQEGVLSDEIQEIVHLRVGLKEISMTGCTVFKKLTNILDLYLQEKIEALYEETHKASERPQSPRAFQPLKSDSESCGDLDQVRTRSLSLPISVRKICPEIEDFEVIRPLTSGTPLEGVYLARKKKQDNLYALKVISKSLMFEKNELSFLKDNEVLFKDENPYVAKVLYSFTEDDFVFMVMEYLPGGDCLSLLIEEEAIGEEAARAYIAQLVLAVDYLHSMGIIHRDLKPDNLLLDSHDRIKLIDYGLSRVGILKRRVAQPSASGGTPGISDVEDSDNCEGPCGCISEALCKGLLPAEEEKVPAHWEVDAPDYIAPEILLCLPHGAEVDWWSLGCILFEFLVGIPPFFGEGVEDTYDNIINRRIAWPAEDSTKRISPAAKDLIEKLLCLAPDKRLGHKGSDEIKSHPFFLGVSWDSLIRHPSQASASITPRNISGGPVAGMGSGFHDPMAQEGVVHEKEYVHEKLPSISLSDLAKSIAEESCAAAPRPQDFFWVNFGRVGRQ